jgi:hypothetical protein
MKALLSLALALGLGSAHAWGPDGHQTVATLAEQLIAGKPAEARVKVLLQGLSLAQAAVWADCAKGVDPAKGYKYTVNPRYEECRPLESPEGIAEMEDYVRRNDQNCPRRPGDESCHKQYHYTDTAVQRGQYRRGDYGTRDDDLVAAMRAAVQVLQGQAAPAPFDFKSPREALLLLVHFAGDLHQPLHVGSVYLGPAGQRLDPRKAALGPDNDTLGGNRLWVLSQEAFRNLPTLALPEADDEAAGEGFFGGPPKLHAVWDGVAGSMRTEDVDAEWLKRARAIRKSPGPALEWPVRWASDTLGQARLAFAPLKFSAQQGKHWCTALPTGYSRQADAIKRRQLTRGGAHLAQLLNAIWP